MLQVFYIHCQLLNDANGRVDILAFDPKTQKGFIIDPTIRWETSEDQPEKVHLEKSEKYNPAIPDLCKRYNLKSLEVIGLFIGARGTISNFFEDFRKKLSLPKNICSEIAISAIKGSIQILNNHLYPPKNM